MLNHIETTNKNCIQLTHQNYVIGFSDGTVKVGTTGRGVDRVKEIVRNKLKDKNCEGVFSYYWSAFRTRAEAYRIERDTCCLLKAMVIYGSREWFLTDAYYVEQVVGMFAGVGLKRSKL